MNDPTIPPLQALPDGEAELRLVLRLQWEDIAALGQEAGRLAAQMRRPVSLDEAASHRLRTRAAATHARPAAAPQHGAPTSVSSLTARTPGEHARQAIEKINGTVAGGHETTQTSA
ncbi:hypothetical protein SLUN_03015 [Streptomyces lunaelactis]|uniref:Uncharacterized protein n=1 Tax=Streptomyces lunaelactis TaxID=1535768 RepID=A0A2R4SWT9_9ACTN|nr:hypothetical protein [Streptomyces lunaelactis]AVZ71350.1 hypothetical protein SLUN_03015 [Streptomyces lunaelactis]NUJ99862.1 hypothetical protein [Streptomyces lunaelactis]NUK07125.1 hypothetical protein [Streptomyces lunaelactis]NUK18827.1 hypothetical protein [Streptomyces lunaelactis]NUK21981.1 hypothetical protein [Streptomyces lunaelactis]